ncbi:MAG: response regulator [Rhodothermales bacterium]|nr:response regulator [Rhodothermales bacterium]MBO6780303.1 response regulator [Rhodothermales bacterium]
MNTPPRILVVEDDPVNLMVITRMLERLGHTADVARNGLQAVQAAQVKDYDIIFMDLMMPELDGIAAARRIRDGRPSAPPMIFAVTANVMPEDRIEAMNAGMNDYVTKPIRMDTIRGLIETSEQTLSELTEFIDVHTLEELRENMGDADFFAELVDEFVENSEELVSTVQSALEADDLNAVSGAAHALKSTSAAFGGTGLSTCAREAEDAVRRGARKDLPAIANRMRAERDRLCKVLQRS